MHRNFYKVVFMIDPTASRIILKKEAKCKASANSTKLNKNKF
jgi:hypothetical protein